MYVTYSVNWTRWRCFWNASFFPKQCCCRASSSKKEINLAMIMLKDNSNICQLLKYCPLPAPMGRVPPEFRQKWCVGLEDSYRTNLTRAKKREEKKKKTSCHDCEMMNIRKLWGHFGVKHRNWRKMSWCRSSMTKAIMCVNARVPVILAQFLCFVEHAEFADRFHTKLHQWQAAPLAANLSNLF